MSTDTSPITELKKFYESLTPNEKNRINVTQIVALSSAIEGLIVNTEPLFRQTFKQRFKRIKDDSIYLNRHFEKKLPGNQLDNVDNIVDIFQEALEIAVLEISKTLKENIDKSRK